jgi:hypothetical protein
VAYREIRTEGKAYVFPEKNEKKTYVMYDSAAVGYENGDRYKINFLFYNL